MGTAHAQQGKLGQEAAAEGEGGGVWADKGTGNLFGVTEMSYILIGVAVTRVYVLVKKVSKLFT